MITMNGLLPTAAAACCAPPMLSCRVLCFVNEEQKVRGGRRGRAGIPDTVVHTVQVAGKLSDHFDQ